MGREDTHSVTFRLERHGGVDDESLGASDSQIRMEKHNAWHGDYYALIEIAQKIGEE
jgi:hypothetical protein